LLLPPALDEWVPANHPVRFVRDFVDALDLSKLGIAEPVAEEGRPPYGPDLLLKVWLYGYMDRIRSTRRLEKACLEVMPFLWLTGNLHPDHNTLWRFFNAHRKALPALFKKLVKMAAEASLIGFVLHALDGTKMAAASSTDEALHRKGLEEKLKQLDVFIAAYMQEVNTRAEEDKGKDYAMPSGMADDEARRTKIRALLERRIEDRKDEELFKTKAAEPPSLPNDASGDGTAAKPESTVATKSEPKSKAKPAAEPPTSEPTGDAQPGGNEPPQGHGTEPTAPASPSAQEPPASPLLVEAQALKRELQAKLAQLDEAGVNHLHEAEPEARMMKGRGSRALGYNAQIVVDHDSDLIVALDVVADQNDLAQLVPMLGQVQETFGRVADESVADTGYANGEQLKSAETKGIAVLVSLREEPEAKGEYSKAHFRYDAENNLYVCPRGEQLLQAGTNKSHATSVLPDEIYRCTNKSCPVRAQCTTDPRGRKIRRPHGEDARARQAEKQKDPRMGLLLGLRKEIVEHLFGIVKTIDGFRRFTVRGLEKARAQWALVGLAVNLRKLSAMASWKAGALAPWRRPLDARTPCGVTG
jgi:transposase